MKKPERKLLKFERKAQECLTRGQAQTILRKAEKWIKRLDAHTADRRTRPMIPD